jgi:hypothetical protein
MSDPSVDQILEDVQDMIAMAKPTKYYGPYYVAYYDRDEDGIVEIEVDEKGKPHRRVNGKSA